MSGTVITMFNKANDTYEGNLSAQKAWGYKKKENIFSHSSVGSGANTVSYVTDDTRATNDIQGTLVTTGTVSDLAIDGAGFFIVADGDDGKNKLSRRGDFRQNDTGFWKNGSGQLLKAWKLDQNGDLPENFALMESIEPVNFANIKGDPTATTVVSIAMNLNSDQQALRGSGVDAVINRSGRNAGKEINDIIYPERIGNSNLALGDSFTFSSSTTGEDKTLTFGGMALARRPDNASNSAIFGSYAAGTSFKFNDPAAGNLQPGHKLRIALSNGQNFTFSAVQGAENAASKTFNTINGLADAINRVSSLKASVDAEGRLYIASNDANNGVTFTNVGGGSIVEELGLANIPQAEDGITRFNSLNTLRDEVNTQQDIYSLKATTEGNDLKITALLSNADFNITANSPGITAINSATLNPNGTEQGRATVYINAPGHNLKAGDFIKANGLNHPQTGDGIYNVTSTNANGFTISLKDADPNTFPVAAATDLNINADASWQKVPGEKFQTFNNPTLNTTGIGSPVTITLPGGDAAATAENWADGDVVYISGVGNVLTPNGEDIIVPDGYYEMTANAAAVGDRTFEIIPTDNIAAAGAPAAGPFSVRKVGTGGIAALDTKAFTTTGGTGPNSAVRMYMPNHGYASGDYISFTNLDAPTDIDGIAIDNNIKYKIVATTDNYLEFQVLDANGTPLPATTGDGSVAVNLSALGANFAVNNSSQLMNYFSLDPETNIYEKNYDPNDITKNLSATANGNSNFDNNLMYSVPITAYDSLGTPFTLLLYFAKLNSNEWAVELATQKDQDGIFDIENIATENGLIKQGIIKFDENGLIDGMPEGFENEVVITRNNGSAPVNLTIDWNNELSAIKTGTVSQYKSPNNVEIIQGTGQGAGTLQKLEVDNKGFVVGTFDSGQTKNIYKIPMGMVANVNGLATGTNGTFEVTRESGELLLKEAGVGGTGKVLGGALEASNVDSIETLLAMQENSNSLRSVARASSIKNDNTKNVLAETNG
jgi:flagellar hook-basal body protein